MQVAQNVALAVMSTCMGKVSVVTPTKVALPTGAGGRGGGGGLSREKLLSLVVQDHQITKELMMSLNGGKQPAKKNQIKGNTGEKVKVKVQKMPGGNPASMYFCTRNACGAETMCSMSHEKKAWDVLVSLAGPGRRGGAQVYMYQ